MTFAESLSGRNKKPKIGIGTRPLFSERKSSATDQFVLPTWRVFSINRSDFVKLDIRVSEAVVDELSLSEGAYDMTNLRPKDTGVPLVIWISQKDGARHGPRVKVTREPRTAHADLSVSITDPIEIKAPKKISHSDKIAKDEWDLLKKWIETNRQVLLRHWDGDLAFADDAKELMKKV
jgi:hypothetical protein